MALMVRALALALLFLVALRADSGQALSVLHIKAILADLDGNPTPVPNHELLLSDEPPSATPRLIVTKLDGTADVSLRPGSYIVESDRAVVFQGKAYQWRRVVTVEAGRDAVLELTAANAEVEAASAAAAPGAAPPSDPSFLAHQWRDSVFGLWSPTAHGSGFLIDAKGLIATSQRVIGAATAVEVQLAPEVKVAARVLAADTGKDVALLWIDPTLVASVRPVPLGCGPRERAPVFNGQEVFAIGVPPRRPKGMTSGTVSRAEPQGLVTDLLLARGSAGGPVFAADGTVIGMTSIVDENDGDARFATKVVRIDGACPVVASAEKGMKDAAAPSATRLPVEPAQPFPADALEETSRRAEAGGAKQYSMSASGFDVVFITPVLVHSGQRRAEQARGREGGSGTRVPDAEQVFLRAITDFGHWSDYVASSPAVLMVRATPRLAEGFWTKVARGAARTQGVAIPPIVRFKSSFARLRAFCGDVEVTPIHPFVLDVRVSEKETIREGLYVFDPGALGPHCASVRLVLYSDKEPEKGDARVVEAAVVQQIWQDFAPFRAAR